MQDAPYDSQLQNETAVRSNATWEADEGCLGRPSTSSPPTSSATGSEKMQEFEKCPFG